MPGTIKASLANAYSLLAPTSETYRLDAEVLLSHVLNKARVYLLTWPEYELSETQHGQFAEFIHRRQQGVPIAYLLGYQEFWSMRLEVSEATLIPRPETELLVEAALSRLPMNRPASILELGTGTGAIALALAKERADCQIIATDIALAALNIAQRNAATHHINQVKWVQSDWFRALETQRFDMIIANPPYLAEHDPHLQQGDLRFEPRHALATTENGLAALRHIITHAPAYLLPQGWLLLEHGWQQGRVVQQWLDRPEYCEQRSLQDLAGHERVVCAKNTSNTAIM